MFIKSITTTSIELGKTICRVTNFGHFKDKYYVVDNYIQNGNTIRKRVVAWNDDIQIIREKVRNKNGKFERIA